MALKFDMRWIAKSNRWEKMVKRTPYTVYVNQLVKLGYLDDSAPRTKEGSRAAANQWLADQLAKAKAQPTNRFAAVVKDLEDLKGDSPFTRGYDYLIDHVNRSADDPEVSETEIREIVPPSQKLLLLGEALSTAKRKAVSTNRTLQHWIDDYLSLRRVDMKAGDLSVSQYDLIDLSLRKFSAFFGADNDVSGINSAKWEAYYKHIKSTKYKAETKKKYFGNPRAFVSWLIERGELPEFASLRAERYQFPDDKEEREPITPEQIAAVKDNIARASGRLKLILLLFANCGFTQKDVSDLTPAQYKDGIITRRRSKTKKKKTRIVSYKLWETTRKLLDEYRTHDGDRLFLTESGKPWNRDEMEGEGDEEKRSKTDAVMSVYRHLESSLTPKDHRQISGDLIRREFGKEVADHFLGHKMPPVDISYFSRDQEKLDKAVDWLGQQYGIK